MSLFKYLKRRLPFMKRWQDCFLRLLFRVLMIPAYMLPLDRGSAFLGKLTATIASRLSVSNKMRASIRIAFPQWDAKRAEALVHNNWNNVGRMVVELAHIRTFFVHERAQRIEVCPHPSVQEFFSNRQNGHDTRPFIIVSAHVCAGVLATIPFLMPGDLQQKEFGFVYNWNAFNNHLVEAAIRISPRLKRLSNKNAYADAARLMTRGQGILVLADKNVRSGVPATFFEHSIRLTRLVPLLALNTNAVIIPAWGFRKGQTASFRLTTGALITADPNVPHKEEIKRINQVIATYMEDQIHHSPSDWLWITREAIELFHPPF